MWNPLDDHKIWIETVNVNGAGYCGVAGGNRGRICQNDQGSVLNESVNA